MKTFLLLAALVACFAATAQAQVASASILPNDLRAGKTATLMTFELVTTTQIEVAGTVKFDADAAIFTADATPTVTDVSGVTGTSCGTTTSAVSSDGQEIVFTLVDGGSNDCVVAAGATFKVTIAASIAENPAAVTVAVDVTTSTDTTAKSVSYTTVTPQVTSAAITPNDLRQGETATLMTFEAVTATELVATEKIKFAADAAIFTADATPTVTDVSGVTGTSCGTTTSAVSPNGQDIEFTIVDGGSNDCVVAAGATFKVTIAASIAVNPSAGTVAVDVTTTKDDTAKSVSYATVVPSPFTVSNDEITLADKAVSASDVITVEFNAGALKTTDTVAIELPDFTATGTVADSSSVCGTPAFSKSTSGTFTITATLGADFDATDGTAKCVLKFSGVTNPSAVASPAYTILITDVAGKQVKTMASAHTIATKTAAAIVPADATFSANPADSSGTITATTAVTLAATGSAHVCYTVDGSTTPACDGTDCASSSGTKFASAISVTATTTIKAIGCGGAGNGDSDVSEKVYTWTAADPTIAPAAGNVAADSAVTLTSAGSANICYTWTGTAPTCETDGTCGSGSTTYNATAKPTVSATSTLKAIGCAGTGKTDSGVASAAYTVNVTATTTAAPAAPASTTISGASTGAVWSAMVTVLAFMGVSSML